MTDISTIPADAQRLVDRLRKAADEIESAARLGVPAPKVLNVDGWEYGNGCGFHASEHEFAAWAEHTEATVRDYEHEGVPWSEAVTDVNGLPMRFHVRHDTESVPA